MNYTAMITGAGGTVGTIIGAWLFIDGYFAHAEDVMEVNQAVTVAEWSFEQSQNLMRQDIIEDRMEREERSPAPDRQRIRKWSKQLDRLEDRQHKLKALHDEMNLRRSTQ